MSEYDTDVLAWSEEQAALLRRIAGGERLNAATPDWPNIIEEIESVGRSQLDAVESLLLQALVHMLKARAWPQSFAAPGWDAEVELFLAQARRRYAPSMRQRLDLAKLYRDALRAVPRQIDGQAPLPLPSTCPLTLDELLADEPGRLQEISS